MDSSCCQANRHNVIASKPIGELLIRARCDAEALARKEAKEYRESSIKNRWIAIVQTRSTEAWMFVWFFALLAIFVGSCLAIFPSTQIIGPLIILSGALFNVLGTLVIVVLGSFNGSQYAMFFWQRSAYHWVRIAKEFGLNRQEVEGGVDALLENRRVEHRYVLFCAAVCTAVFSVLKEFQKPTFILREFASLIGIGLPCDFEGNPIKYVLPPALIVAGVYFFRYFVPNQWNRQTVQQMKLAYGMCWPEYTKDSSARVDLLKAR